MHAHTWEDPKIYKIQIQKQAKQGDWPKETWKKCPTEVLQTTDTTRAWLSLIPSVCLSTSILFLKTYVSLLTISMWNSFLHSWQARTLSLATGLMVWIQCPHCWGLTSISGQELKSASSCYRPRTVQKRSSWPRLSQWCDHSCRARHPGMQSQVGLRKRYYEQS